MRGASPCSTPPDWASRRCSADGADGGPEGRYIDYWQRCSFGDLSATAQTRKAVLERLIPRLKIAGRCSFADRFLVVRGDLRTSKIHLGSGNILMEPNDQSLCIVPKRSAVAEDRLFLPFEGDGTLSVILSKLCSWPTTPGTRIPRSSIRSAAEPPAGRLRSRR
ncbi:MAG TPA: hypothetical protein VG406_04630 [Isosphaeraceae bacterium]|jgi:hypothetical protein|nr:hypothetical protein [Isosphaeraceae bacterium]